MDRFIEDLISEMFSITIENEYQFRTLYSLTFVFRRSIAYLNERIVSSEIHPAGIIYEENGEYYYAPLDEGEKIDEIIHEFVKKI